MGIRQKFSESILWDWQQSAYEVLGSAAWTSGGVPSYLTSCPLTASHYAALAASYLDDQKGSIDPSEPIWIIDLGAGSGRFAYLFLLFLFQRLQGTPLQIRYLLTDFVEKNRNSWKKHPLFLEEPFLSTLEFASFLHSDPHPFFLEKSGRDLDLHRLQNPKILIANYFFDTIPQSLYRIQNGQLFEGFLTLQKKREELLSLEDITEVYSYGPIEIGEVPGPSRSVLEEYCRTKQESTFLFPSEALAMLSRFSKAQDKILLLASDQGIATEEEWLFGLSPCIHKHGTFSVPVNYHALGRWFHQQGGESWLRSSKEPHFVTGAFSLGGGEFPAFSSCWERRVARFSVWDYWMLGERFFQEEKNPSLSAMCDYLLLGEADPHPFYQWFSAIRKKLPSASSEEKEIWNRLIQRIGVHFFPIGEEKGDFFQNLGVLFFEMGDSPKALFWFEKARAWSGDLPVILQNIQACIERLG